MSLLLSALLALAAPQLDEAPNFTLLDEAGRAHELHRLDDSRAVVLYVHGNACPIVRGSTPELQRLVERFEEDGVEFLAINANPQDDRASVAEEVRAYGFPMPVLLDDDQLVLRAYGLTRTAEAIVLRPSDWSVLFRGAIDDRLDYGARRDEPEHTWLRDVLAAVVAGEASPHDRAPVKGCAIETTERATPDYAGEIAPLLEKKCVRCHRKGEVAPFAFDSHRRAAGWGAMIQEVLLTRRMPPWHADPSIGRFHDDLSMSASERQLLYDWIAAGAPRGEGEDPLPAAATPVADGWAFGEPDLVLRLPESFEIPAEGTVDYQYFEIETGLDDDTWIRAVEVRPTAREAVHHVLAFVQYPTGKQHLQPEVDGGARGYFAAFVPGARPRPFPDEAAKILPGGATLLLQIHYTPTGRAQRDRTELALWFAEEPPARRIVTEGAVKYPLRIPPGDPDHAARASYTLPRAMRLHGMSPHMHYRGARFAYRAELPGGERRELLRVPRYAFDFQTFYELAEPIDLPRGTRIVCEGAFDNSARNPWNPDPDRWVRFGEQTWDEMFIGYLEFSTPVGAVWEELAASAAESRLAALGDFDPVTPDTLVGTEWRGRRLTVLFEEDGALVVNESMRGSWGIEGAVVDLEVAGNRFELTLEDGVLVYGGRYPLQRLR